MDISNTIALSRTGTAGLRQIAETPWFNALWFQATWFCAVLGRESLLPLTAGLILLHLALVQDRTRELRQIGLVALVGICIDAALSGLGLCNFAGNTVVPLWLCGLWLAFATTLSRSLSFLATRQVLAAVAGALVVPINYAVGARFGAVELGYSSTGSFMILALVWAILLPSLYLLVEQVHERREKQ